MSINIRRDNKDPFYRYKMPPIQSKIEGKGNGIKTAVVNASDVARALSRPPAYVIKYFGFELGAQTSLNEKDDRFIVNGVHDSNKLQDSLDGFIAKFVLCGSCKNPETDFAISKDGTVKKDCKACGAKTVVDPGHRLTSYIVKSPPAQSKSKKKAMANAGASTKAEPEQTDDQDELTRRINAEAATLPELNESEGDEEEWTADVSEEAVRARQKNIERSMATLGLDQTAFTEFGEWVEAQQPQDVEIYKKAVEMGIAAKPETLQVLAQAIFTNELVSEIKEHAGLLSKLVTSPEHEMALLGGIERLIGVQHPDLVRSVPNVLFKLYENDLVGEETAQRWGTKASKRYVDKETSKKVRRAAKPFLDWLDEASEESDE